MNIRYLWAELTRRRSRTLTALLSIALGVALFISLQAYAAGYQHAARAPLGEIGADIAVQREGQVPEAFEGPVFPHSVAPIHQETIAAIQRLPGVEAVGETIFFWDFAPERFSVVLGLDPADEVGPGRLRAAVVDGRFLAPNTSGEVVADVSFARQNNLTLGTEIQIAKQPFKLVGLVDTSRAGQVANANFYLSIADARSLVVAAPNVGNVHDIQPNDANILFLKVHQSQIESVVAEATKLLEPGALISSEQSFDEVLGASFQLIDRFGWLVGLAGLLVAVAALLRTVVANMWERRRDIGLMRAVGWQRSDIIRQLVAETAVLGLGGSCLGLGLAAVVTLALSQTQVTIPVPWELSPTPHFMAGGAKELAVTIALPAQITLGSALIALVLALLCSTAVGFVVARRAAQQHPAEVLRSD